MKNIVFVILTLNCVSCSKNPVGAQVELFSFGEPLAEANKKDLDEHSEIFFIKDKDHPYIQEKPFDWIRGYQVGGKSLTWGRACQRWSEYELSGIWMEDKRAPPAWGPRNGEGVGFPDADEASAVVIDGFDDRL